MLYCCWYSIDKHWQRHKLEYIQSIIYWLMVITSWRVEQTNKNWDSVFFSACPDGYFYGGEIEQSSQRDMVVEKGETSPTYRSFNSWIIRIFLPFPFCCSSYDDYWQLLLGPHLEHCLGKCNSTVRIFQSYNLPSLPILVFPYPRALFVISYEESSSNITAPNHDHMIILWLNHHPHVSGVPMRRVLLASYSVWTTLENRRFSPRTFSSLQLLERSPFSPRHSWAFF